VRGRKIKYRLFREKLERQSFDESKPLPNYQNNHIKSSVRLDLFVILKYQSNFIILSVGIEYSMRDLLCDLLCLTHKVAICAHAVNNVSVPSGISSL